MAASDTDPGWRGACLGSRVSRGQEWSRKSDQAAGLRWGRAPLARHLTNLELRKGHDDLLRGEHPNLLQELLAGNGLADVAVGPDREEALAVTLHGVGREHDDRQMLGARLLRLVLEVILLRKHLVKDEKHLFKFL